MERDFLWSFFPFVPWETTQGVSGVMLMDWGGWGVSPFVVVVCFDFFYLSLAISFYFVQMVFLKRCWNPVLFFDFSPSPF